MNIKKLTAVLSAAAMMFSLTSCGLIDVKQIDAAPQNGQTDIHTEQNVTLAPSTDVYSPVPQSEKRLSDARKNVKSAVSATYDGDTVFVTKSYDCTVFSDDCTSVTEKLTYIRNTLVEEELEVHFVTEKKTPADMLAEAKRKKAAGDVTADVLLIPSDKAALFAAEKTLSDLSKLSGFDANADYFSAQSASGSSIGKEIYSVAGNASFSPDNITAVFFNKTLLSAAGIDADEIYSSVNNNEWTWDTLLSYAAVTVGSITTPFGASTLGDVVFKSAGLDYLKKTDGKITAGFDFDGLKTVSEVLKKLTDCGIRTSSYTAADDFIGGDTVFMIHKLSALEKIGDSSVDFGIVPVPTCAAGESYRTALARTAVLFAVSKDSHRPQTALDSIKALNAASHSILSDGYREYLFTDYFRESESAKMTAIILSSGEYDGAYILGAEYPEVAAATYNFAEKYKLSDEKTFMKQMKTAQTAMQKALDKAAKQIAKKK